ncbi:MAG: RHS repeat-associated core domain-containing protein, partial [Actinomycetota bacterium]
LPDSSSNNATYAHDASGELTRVTGSSRNWVFSYDAWGRQTIAAGVPPSTATYDALDRTVRRIQAGVPSAYTYEGQTEDLAASIVPGVANQLLKTFYVNGPGGPLAQKSATGNVRFYLTDPHGDVVGLKNPSAGLTWSQTYSPWGERRRATGLERPVFGFQGDFTDAGTGQVDMGTRLYDPGLGRFTNRDVLFGDPRSPPTLNQYVYGLDAPINFVDPTGAYPLDTGGCGRECKPNHYRRSWDCTTTDCANDSQAANYWMNMGVPYAGQRYLPPNPNNSIGGWLQAGALFFTLLTGPEALELDLEVAAGTSVATGGSAAGLLGTGARLAGTADLITADASLSAGSVELVSNAAETEVGAAGEAAAVRPSGPYIRPSGATTAAQRASVQGLPCVECGATAPVQVADHINPLVREWYETGTIDETFMRSPETVQPMCPICSASQGGQLSWWSRTMREFFGFG